MAKNAKQWSSATPGLLIILIDQSGSMTASYEGNDSRTIFAARAVNRVINDIIEKNFNGTEPKNRCFITVIGYDLKANVLCSGYLKELYANPKRIDELTKKIPDGAGGLVETQVKMPIWVEPIKEDKWTNMKDAFSMAKGLVKDWIQDKPENPAPVIINISDGVPYYDQKSREDCMSETEAEVAEIRNMTTEDGNVLVFNAQIGDGKEMIVFPNSEDAVEADGDEAKFLYRISSDIPDGYMEAATKNELNVQSGSKGCVFHADAEHLIKLIDFGSSKGLQDKG
jgi:hypothetical protein